MKYNSNTMTMRPFSGASSPNLFYSSSHLSVKCRTLLSMVMLEDDLRNAMKSATSLTPQASNDIEKDSMLKFELSPL